MGKCRDCLYSKPATVDCIDGDRKCNWNHRRHSPDHECEIHSFFPKKQGKEPENEIQERG